MFPKEAETFMKAELSLNLNSLICLGVKVIRIWKTESAYRGKIQATGCLTLKCSKVNGSEG